MAAANVITDHITMAAANVITDHITMAAANVITDHITMAEANVITDHITLIKIKAGVKNTFLIVALYLLKIDNSMFIDTQNPTLCKSDNTQSLNEACMLRALLNFVFY